MFILPSFLKYICIGHRNLGWQVLFPFLLGSVVFWHLLFMKRSYPLFVSSLYGICSFSLTAFKIFLFIYGYQHFEYDMPKCCFFIFIPLGVHWAARLCKLSFSANLGNFKTLFYVSSFLFSLLSSWHSSYT